MVLGLWPCMTIMTPSPSEPLPDERRYLYFILFFVMYRCVGAVKVTVIDQRQPHIDNSVTHGGGGSGSRGGGHKLFVPIVLEALPESCLGVPKKLDLGVVALDSQTASSFEVQNLSAGPGPLRYVPITHLTYRDTWYLVVIAPRAP